MNTHNAYSPQRIAASRPSVLGVLCGFVLTLFLFNSSAAEAQMGPDRVRQYIERTEELLVWAQGLVAETESEPARRVLRQATELHRRSQGMYQRGMIGESQSVARRARDAMWHAVRVAREAMGLEERIRVQTERFRDQYGALIERARELRNQQALEFLGRAENQAGRARDIYQQGDFRLAWRLLEQARDLMQRAARLLADSVGPERLTRELERTRHLIENARDRLAADGTSAQRQRLAEADEALQRALTARDQGQPGRSLRMAGLAGNLARRALQEGSAGPNADAVRRQLERFDVRAERLQDRLRQASAPQARQRFERALAQRDRAERTLQQGDQELALRQIRAAHDLLNQAENLIR